MTIRKNLMAVAIAIVMLFSMLAVTQTANMGPAKADSELRMLHRDTSVVSTLRVYNLDRSKYEDASRGEVVGYLGLPFRPRQYYVPTSRCAEENFYINNVLQSQRKIGAWGYSTMVTVPNTNGYYSIRIYDPGADQICN